LMALALARIRQLSAHEVGHTLGLGHNFAASTYNRASVMDYPHPYLELKNNNISSENAYAEDIGVWDKAVIAYGYQVFPESSEAQQLAKILENNQQKNMLFISDPDARKISDAHPKASLWDNGADAVDELHRVITLRNVALSNFGKASLHSGRPYSDLQEILMPVYYFHRYQSTAAAKYLGGINYDYGIKSATQDIKPVAAVDAKSQLRALDVLLKTLTPDFLSLSDDISKLLFPKALGYQLTRESPEGNTGARFDEVALASASAQHSLSLLLHPSRLARLQQQNALDDNQPGITSITDLLEKQIIDKTFNGTAALIHQSTVDLIYSNYINLLQDAQGSNPIKISLYEVIHQQIKWLKKKTRKAKSASGYTGFYVYQLKRLESADPENKNKSDLIKLPTMPPGSPI